MKSLFKALTLSCLGVVMALAMVISTTSCTPGPETNTNEDYKGPIAKVLLFTNPAAPTNLYSAVSYERTATAHVFYVKTTFVRAKFIDELTNIDSRIGKATRDFWGQFFMGLDIKSKTASVKNAAKVGVTVKTANADFEFDGLFRAGSWDGGEGVKFNKVDGVPFIVESHNFLINILNDGADPTDNNNYWSVSTEKFWMTSTDKDDTEMVGGVGTDVEFTVVDETNGDVLETNKVATDFIKYDTNSGEYMFMIPFSIVAKSDLKSVCVFGVENAGWVGSVNAVIKPLGSDVSVVYSDGENKVTGLTAVTIPTTTNEAPVITEYVPQSAYLGAITFDSASYAVFGTTTNIVVNVADPDLVGGSDFDVTITGGLTNVTVTLTETDPGSFTGTCTVGKNGTSADVVADAANTNFTISVTYTDLDPSTNVIATADVIVEKIGYNVDGLLTPEYTDLGVGGGTNWAAEIGHVYAKSSNNVLYVAVAFTTVNSGNNIWVLLDDTSLDSAADQTAALGDAAAGYGDLGINNTIGMDIDLAVRGWRDGAGTDWNDVAGFSITADATNAASGLVVNSAYVEAYEFSVPFAEIGAGASVGEDINIYVLFGKDSSGGGIQSVYPFPQDPDTAAGVTDITNSGTAYTLE